MRRWLAAGIVLALMCLAPSESHADGSPIGRWLTGDRQGVVEIIPCGRGFCGRVIGMMTRTGTDGLLKHDTHGHPQCGLTIIEETQQVEPNLWRARITNPDDGNVWRCEIWIDGDTLHLRGYVLLPLLGRTTDWTRYAGRIGPSCLMS